MGWIWGSESTDPLRNLDPSLREFLTKESPVRYDEEPQHPPVQAASSEKVQAPSSIPQQSLYPDGRYAHLWKNYQTLASVENATKSDQEKLGDVLEGYKSRRAQIGRAAVENCVLEQLAVQDCYARGPLAKKMTLCRAENKAFERCYNVQSRFLKTLGYLADLDRPDVIDENIQMHADTLYHRMLAEEAQDGSVASVMMEEAEQKSKLADYEATSKIQSHVDAIQTQMQAKRQAPIGREENTSGWWHWLFKGPGK